MLVRESTITQEENARFDRAMTVEHVGVRKALCQHLYSRDLALLIIDHVGRLDFAQKVHEFRATAFADKWSEKIWRYVLGPITRSSQLPPIGFSSLNWLSWEFLNNAHVVRNTPSEYEEFMFKVMPCLRRTEPSCGVTRASMHRALHTGYILGVGSHSLAREP